MCPKLPAATLLKNSLIGLRSFSISKWIHLNGGDDGLLKFFRRVSDVLRHGGKFVLEPQAWESYAKAKRMDIVILHSNHDFALG